MHSSLSTAGSSRRTGWKEQIPSLPLSSTAYKPCQVTKSSHHSEPVFTWLEDGKCQLAWQRHRESSMYVQPTVSPSETQEVMSFTESSHP